MKNSKISDLNLKNQIKIAELDLSALYYARIYLSSCLVELVGICLTVLIGCMALVYAADLKTFNYLKPIIIIVAVLFFYFKIFRPSLEETKNQLDAVSSKVKKARQHLIELMLRAQRHR